MNSKKVTELLKQLRTEINNNRNEIDSETEQQLIQMDADIHQLLQSNDMQQQDLYQGIMQMEYGFLTKHPVAANLMREMIDILSKAGI
jgi:malate synthase